MRKFSLITVLLLCSHSWICESQTVEVQQGEDATLLCSNISTSPTQTEWFRVVNRTKPSCISAMYGAEGEASLCDGLKDGKFEMSSNMSTVFLRIKQVDFSDSGLYFCGFYMNGHTVVVSAAELMVQGENKSIDGADLNSEKADGSTDLMKVILGALTGFFTVVLAVSVWKLQKAANEEAQPGRNSGPCRPGPCRPDVPLRNYTKEEACRRESSGDSCYLYCQHIDLVSGLQRCRSTSLHRKRQHSVV
ncbi:uncharacterized protein LOC121639901 isoform X1 [Melanotaenia boesemani]|uniref:uncharacterized protein LOC121639901 isoform X1 n=1 Tax=Melanotaenia boesemani TaxID=1250792 RepID=UPI001C0541AB|nr:uncharacterized protein LOC121639901 isoform X1 [Melanotaenia boesemani]